LDLALQHHIAGDLSKAENIYQQILQTDPNCPDALHLLGVISHQAGKRNRAVDLIKKALIVKPDYAEAHNNFGNVLKEVLKEFGKLEEAVASYQTALTFKPYFPEAGRKLLLAMLYV